MERKAKGTTVGTSPPFGGGEIYLDLLGLGWIGFDSRSELSVVGCQFAGSRAAWFQEVAQARKQFPTKFPAKFMRELQLLRFGGKNRVCCNRVQATATKRY